MNLIPDTPPTWPVATVAGRLGVDVADLEVILQQHGDTVVDGQITRQACGDLAATLDPRCERTVPWPYRDVALDDEAFAADMREFLGAHAMPRLGPHLS